MDPVPTQYIDRDGAALAYQVVGDGPVDVVCCWDLVQHLDLSWTDPDTHHLLERGASYSRTVHFQLRGFGLSDRLAYVPTLEQQAGDVLAIMDAVGMRSATLCGLAGTDRPLALVAANTPERVNALVLVNTASCRTKPELADVVERIRHAFDHWGSGETIDVWDSVQASPYNRRLMAMLERSSATPAAARSYLEWALQQDLEDILPLVQAPTPGPSSSRQCHTRGTRPTRRGPHS